MANEQNLKPFTSEQDREKAKKNGIKGGIRSGEVRRARKSMREMLDYLLQKQVTTKDGQSMETQEAILVATIRKAIGGNMNAVSFIRDTIGEKPVDKVVFTPTSDSLKDIEDLVDGK